jgi:hypothetical protein|tara:strand:- start:18 stop:134 length:117 start_codon:yes stop_codon:yes gene_type:complete
MHYEFEEGEKERERKKERKRKRVQGNICNFYQNSQTDF